MSQQTKSLLLDVAGSIFAEQGYRAASIREICQRADINIALVQHHFGDKETIYTEALRLAYREALHGPLEFLLASRAPAGEKLRLFIATSLRRKASSPDSSWHGKLITRELFDPSPPFETVIRELLDPLLLKLGELIRELLGAEAGTDQVRLCALSVLGHCIYFDFNQPLLSQLIPPSAPGADQLDQWVDHIHAFCLGGISRIKLAGSPSCPARS